MRFSLSDRPQHLAAVQHKEFDLLIIGGGITGCGIALDAASRGLSVALLEKDDFAAGTSSKSTKLIHGGLRYLKQLEFGLVKEVGSERAIVHRLAPHLVVPEKMLLPLTARSLGATLTSIGLKIYDWLARVKHEDRRKMLTRPQTLRREPMLNKDGVKGGALYAEYRTDDARLTISIAKTAFQYGALLINHCRVCDFIYDHDQIIGVAAMDEIAQTKIEVKAKVVVSAAGPWVDDLRTINGSRSGKRLHLTKGVHLVLPKDKLPIQQAIYFDVEDGRMIFAIPRGRTTYVGTTDTNYEGDKDHVYTSKDDAEYLIRALNYTFPSAQIRLTHIESSWAGLRPLIHEEGKSASELSRKDEIFESTSGLISIAGGKLTGYRKMAERVVDLVIEKKFENRNLTKCTTAQIGFIGGEFSNYEEVNHYIGAVRNRLKVLSLPAETAHYLVGNYGKQSDLVLDEFVRMNGQGDLDLLRAEFAFCLQHEMVASPSDFYIRRTGLLFFDRPRLVAHMNAMLDTMKEAFSWDEDRFDEEVKLALADLNRVTEFAE